MRILVLRDDEDGTLHLYKMREDPPNIEEFVTNFGDAAVFDTEKPQPFQPDPKYGVKLQSLGQVIAGKVIK